MRSCKFFSKAARAAFDKQIVAALKGIGGDIGQAVGEVDVLEISAISKSKIADCFYLFRKNNTFYHYA